MLRPSLFIAVLAASILGTPFAHADITPVNYPTPLAAVGPVSGDVMNIDPVNNNIQIKDASGIVLTIHVDDNVQISHRGENVRIGDLDLNDFITVTPK